MPLNLLTSPTTTDTVIQEDLIAGSLPDLTLKLKELKDAQSQALDNREWVTYQQQIEHVQYQIDALKGSWKEGLQATFTITTNDSEVLSQLAEIQGVTIEDKTVTVQADTVEAYNDILNLTKDINGTTVRFQVKPDVITTERVVGKSITSESGLSDFINGIKKQIQDADFGSDIYQSLTEKLADATMLQNLVQESLRLGLGTALFDVADETGQDFWDRVLSPEGVANADWQGIADVINQKRKEMGLEAITLDFNTGSVTQHKPQNEEDTYKGVISGLSQVSSGLEQMGAKIPEGVSSIIKTAQGLITVIDGMKTVTELLRGPAMSASISSQTANTSAISGLTAAVLANTAVLSANIAAESTEAITTALKIAAIAAMAQGGIVPHAAQGYAVPGNHYSGDTTPIMANAGELVLNRAQQGNLASQLEDSRDDIPSVKPYVTGQDIYLGLNNYLIGAGMGQLVTTKSMKN